MKQIYHFDSARPPVLNEKILREKIERRKAQRQTVLLVLLGILMDWSLIMLGFLLYPINAFFSTVCFFHACIAIVGGLVIAAIYSTHNTRRNLT